MCKSVMNPWELTAQSKKYAFPCICLSLMTLCPSGPCLYHRNNQDPELCLQFQSLKTKPTFSLFIYTSPNNV